MTSFHLNRWPCQCGGAKLCLEKSKCGSQYQDSSRYLLRDFNPEGYNITPANVFGLFLDVSSPLYQILVCGIAILPQLQQF